jgi:anti-anti-sigma factor
MTGAFAVTKEYDSPGVVRLVVSGEIDRDVSEALAVIIVNAITHEPLYEVVLDLAHVSFLAAAGVRSLIEGRAEAIRRGTTLRLTGAYGVVAFVLSTLAGELDELRELVSRRPGSPTPPCRPAPAGSPSGATTPRPAADLDRW